MFKALVIAVAVLTASGCTSATVKSTIARKPEMVGRSRQTPPDVVSTMATYGGVQYIDTNVNRVVYVAVHPVYGNLMQCVVMDAKDDGDGWTLIEIRSDGIAPRKRDAMALWDFYVKEVQPRGVLTQRVATDPVTR